MQQSEDSRNKVLLMGKAQAGKTSMKSIIFANFLAKDTSRLGPTIKIAHSTLKFLGDLTLNLWDCGGQDKFLQSYFDSQRDNIFRNVAVLIYVFDIKSLENKQDSSNNKSGMSINSGNNTSNFGIGGTNYNNRGSNNNNNNNNGYARGIGGIGGSGGIGVGGIKPHKMNHTLNKTIPGLSNDIIEFQTAIGAIKQHSPKAQIFCLIHKMDVIKPEFRHSVFAKHCKVLEREANTFGLRITCYATSIWNETLFKAWSKIVCSLLADQEALNKELQNLCKLCCADEIVLFESATLLFVCNATFKATNDSYRFEKIANIVKQFKLRCDPSRYLFKSMKVSNKQFTAYIGPFTKTTNILVIISNPNIEMDAVMMNLQQAKPAFAKLLSLHVAKNNRN